MNCFSNIYDQIFHKNFRVKIKLDNTLSTNETVVYNMSLSNVIYVHLFSWVHSPVLAGKVHVEDTRFS